VGVEERRGRPAEFSVLRSRLPTRAFPSRGPPQLAALSVGGLVILLSATCRHGRAAPVGED
jgi:hypothetical protein